MKTRAPNSSVPGAFRALSDSTRLRIVHLLLPGELCVCDLMAVLRLSQPLVSRHLAYLRRAGLVESRSEGAWRYYRLASSPDAWTATLLECVRQCSAEMPQLATDAARLRGIRRRGCC
jgi:ArsR family transcriptional regulator